MKCKKTRRAPGLSLNEEVVSESLYHEKEKRAVLDWVVLVIVVGIAGVVIALSFGNTALLANELHLNPYLVAGLVEILFASLLFIRGKQRATKRNVPLFLSVGYFTSLAFVTAVNMWGLSQENPIIGSIVGLAISGAMWLMESILVWLWVDSHRPHQKSLREIKKDTQREIKETKLMQRVEWMKWEAEKPDLRLIQEARKAEEKRKKVVGDGLPTFFRLKEPGEIREVYPVHREKPGDIVPDPVDHREKPGYDSPGEREKAPNDRETAGEIRETHRETTVGDSPVLKLAPPPSPVEVIRAIEKREKKRPGRRRLAREAGISEHDARVILDGLKEKEKNESA